MRRRSQRDGEYTSCSSSAQRYGLGGDPDPVGVGEVVDGDPVARLTRRPPEELPGAFRVGGEGPLEQPEGEPARLEMWFAEQAVRDEQQLGGPFATGLVPEPAAHGGQERPPDAVDRADPGADELHPFLVFRVCEALQSAAKGGRERVRVADVVREGAAERFGRGLAGGHERDRALGGRARGGCGGGHRGVRRNAAGQGDVAVALAKLVLAGLIGGDVDAGRRGQDPVRARVDDVRGRVDDPAAGVRDPPLRADRLRRSPRAS